MRVYLQTANLQYKYKKFIVSVGQCSMFVPRQLGSSKLGITVPHDVLMSNQFAKIWCFIPGKKQSNSYLWHLIVNVKGRDEWHWHDSLTSCAPGDRNTTLMFLDSGQCAAAYLVQWWTAMMHCSANIHVNCMQPIFHVTISTSFYPFDGLALSWLACSIADFYVAWELLCFVFPMFCF